MDCSHGASCAAAADCGSLVSYTICACPGRPAPSSWPAPRRSGKNFASSPNCSSTARRLALHREPHAQASHQFALLRHLPLAAETRAPAAAMSGALPLTATRRNLPKRQRAVARSQTWLMLRRKPPRKTVGLQLRHHDDQFVVLEQMAIGVDHGLIGRGFDHAGLVVELEERQLAALAVDHAEVVHDAGQQLRLARVDQIVDLALARSAALPAPLRRTGGPTDRSRPPSSPGSAAPSRPRAGPRPAAAPACWRHASRPCRTARPGWRWLRWHWRSRRRDRSTRPATRGSAAARRRRRP